jgi:cytochrome c-type biogenesis protein CcmF
VDGCGATNRRILLIAELGHLSLWVALVLGLAQMVLPLLGAWRGIATLQLLARPLAWLLALCLTVALAALAWAFYAHDFTIEYVAKNSNSALPLRYRLSAIWGGHEGSLLLWVWMLSVWGAAVALFTRSVPRAMVARVLSVMGFVSVGFLLFMLLTSNPFARALPWPPMDGQDLNPLLQDPGLIIHPPMLYMGYVGFSVAFAFAIAGLLAGKLDPTWARWARPWTTVAWCFLTLGVALGSWWAYYELGWGGGWFWDPVENASFMPWLAGTALIHSLAVTEKRGLFRPWTVLLAIVTFSLSLLGTFLVRSGVLTSVHAFATDPARGAFVLGFLVVTAGGGLMLYAFRAPVLKSAAGFRLCSRESFLMVNNLVLLTAAFVVLLGTLFPLVGEAMGMKISVRSPYFNAFFVPLTLVLMLAMVPGMMSRWGAQELRPLLRRLAWIVPAAAVGGIWGSRLPGPTPWPGTLALVLALYVVLAHLDDVARRVSAASTGPVRGLMQLPRGYKGMVLAHCGLALTVAGVTLVSNHEVERDMRLAPGGSVEMAGYTFNFQDLRSVDGPNYDALQGEFRVTRDGVPVAQLQPQKRTYRASGRVMTEAAIDAGLLRDLYVSLGEPLQEGRTVGAWAVRVYYKPGVRWIWLGALITALGGALALLDKRYRRPVETGETA